MKKFIFIFLLFFSSFVGFSQILIEDFEAAPDAADASGVWANTSGNWLVKDNRTNTGINWQTNVAPFGANGGTKAAFVNREFTGAGILAEEWLITPQRNIVANSQLRFFTRQTFNGDFGTKYQIRVSSAADQSDLSQYTTIVMEYTETELSTLTADQLDYEEKIIDLGFTGQRYFAFVKVFTQPTGALGGDRWLIDDVKIVEKCLDPVAPLGTPVIGATTTRLEWTSTNQNFQVQYGPAGFALDVPAPNVVISPEFNNTSTPRRRYEATGLLANTCYQFYVRSVCDDSNSNWVGPFNWCTLPLGRTCAEPIVATNPLPYSDTSNTTIYGNNIVNGSPGGATLCGAGAGFLAGNDVVYSYTATAAGNIFISMNPNGATNTGVFVYASCANVGTTCLAGVGNATANLRVIPSLAVTAGQTIFIVISSTTATPTFPYTLTIQQATCPQPFLLEATVTGPTSANASWQNNVGSTATAWEIAVQTAGSDVPTGAGTATTTNVGYTINTTLGGTPLTPGTAYQYWVRADCGDGLFSPWSGPFLFSTTLCETTQQCNYEFILSDLAGGWEGGRMQVIQSGVVLQTLGASLPGTGPLSVFVPLCNNIPFELFWSEGGNFPDEIRVAIKNTFGQTIYALTTNGQTSIGTTLYSGPVDCINPLCLKPGNPTVPGGASLTFNSALVNWTSSGVPTTGWELYVVTQGSPVPDPTTVPSYIVPFQVPPPAINFTIPAVLLPDTNYTVYVRSICSVNGPSDWSNGTNFKTKEQCPKPTALGATALTPFGATFNWTNPTGTSWQIIVQLAALPDPAVDDVRWDDLVVGGSPFLYNGAPLIPETGYEYYIRTLCDGGIISNPAGPRPFTTGIACPKPTGLSATPTSFGATFTWTNPTATAWQVLVLPAGSPAPTAATTGWIPATANPFLYDGPLLTPETNYVYYVRTDCGVVNGLSTWAGPRPFTTTPTCFKPTALNSNSLTAFSVNLTWASVATTTAWHVLALPVGSPAPDATTTGWIGITLTDVTNPTPGNFGYVYSGLTPETAYVFYIRGNCEPGFGISTWTGPRPVTTPPSCYKPSLQTATILTPFDATISPFTATLGWTNNVNSPVTEWQISIQAPGSAAPAVTQIGTTVNANPYLATGLTQNTCYDYYVRSVCGGVNGLSTWTGPFNFCTPPTCPQPINGIGTNTSEPNANLSWTETASATEWEIIIQAPTGPVPGPTTSGTVLTAFPYNTGTLTPGFYEFYVRSICSDVDNSLWSGPFNFFIATAQPVCASVDITIATTSPGIIDLCPGENCVDLEAVFTDSKDTTTYSVLPVVFAPPFPFTGGTQLPVTTDDVWSAPFTLPFNFCFYGINYPTVNVGSNGVITFNTQAANANCPWAYTESLPDPGMPILNAIYGPYQDINPNVDTAPILRSINYQILGEAPCRAFVVNFYNIAQFSCNLTVPLQTSQIVLYETSNVIEVYIENRVPCLNWNGGNAVIGIQNAAGTVAHWPPDRNTGQWTAQNEAWRFTPDGNSNVEFSWLKDGVFYSSEPTIEVCVSETTNMTAQALYTGCGGQTDIETEDVLLRINEVLIEPIDDVVACVTYTLPVLPVGNYFTQTGGVGPIDITIPITTIGTQTIYAFAETTTDPACEYEVSFTLTIQDVLVAPDLQPVTSCLTYSLPALASPFNYYTGALGTGTTYSGLGGDVINSTQTLFVYGVLGECEAQDTFSITIDPILTPDFNSPLTFCVGTTAPAFELTSPNGIAGTWSPATIQTATIGASDYVFTPNGGTAPSPNLLANGDFSAGNTGFTSDYQYLSVTIPAGQQKTYGIVDNANVWFAGFAACTDHTSGSGNMMVADGSTSNAGNDILWNQTIPVTANENYIFSYYLQSVVAENPAQIDVVINGTVVGSATAGATICDWVEYTYLWNSGISISAQITLFNRTLTSAGNDFAIDDLSFIQNTSPCATPQTITVNITSEGIIPTFAAISDFCSGTSAPQLEPISQNNISGSWSPGLIDNITVGTATYSFTPDANQCATNQSLTVNVTAPNIAPTFAAISDFCSGTSAPQLEPISQNNISGSWSPSVIDNITIGTATYNFTPDANQCSLTQTLTVNVTAPNITPTFAAISDFCSGTSAPQLEPISQNNISGSWSPSVIDNITIGTATYNFTPDANQCSLTQTLTVNVTAPNITPTFAAISDFCSGTSAPQLEPISLNSISGSWSPSVIDNITVGTTTYSFTPDANQCSTAQTLTVNVTAPNITPTFAAISDFCSGTSAPQLEPISLNSISGSWSPSVIDNITVGTTTYSFTPDANQCAITQTLTVNVTAPNITPTFAAITDFCSGASAPQLEPISVNSISGSWSPSVVDNTTVGIATYTFTPNAGQCALQNTLDVTVLLSSTPDFDPSLTICSGGTAPILEPTSPNGITGSWSPSIVDAAQSGVYVFTPDANQCASVQNIDVTISSNPQFAIIGGCLNGKYTLAVSSTDFNIEAATFVWKFEGTVINGQTSSTIIVSQTGSYTCEVSYQGCSTSEPFNAISVSCLIQKGISPSGTGVGDGKNDYFDLEGQNVAKLEIFNRYGTIVYSKANYSKEWYGQSDSGAELPDGTYYYVIERNGEDSVTGWIYINHEL